MIERPPFSEARWNQLAGVNNLVNGDLLYVSDIEHFGIREQWEYPVDKKGDCEDYALAKIKLLREQGWPKGSLDIAVCRTETGDAHAVVVAHLATGDFILDNRMGYVVPWSDTRYTWIEVSRGGDFADWVKVST